MADENEQEQKDEGGGGKKKWIMIGAIGLVVVIAIGVTLWLMMSGSDSSPSASSAAEPTSSMSSGSSGSADVGNAFYVGMPRAFVFIVPGDARERTVQIKVQLMVRGEESEELAKRHIPLIEGALHEVFSSSTADELKTVEGKMKLRDLALQEVRAALTEVEGKPLVEQVLFTSMVMQ